MVHTPQAHTACASPRFNSADQLADELWEVDVTDIDAALWMSPKEVEDLRENQCASVAVDLGQEGIAGFGVRKQDAQQLFVDNEVAVEKFNRAPDGSMYHAESAGALQIGDVVKFVNGRFVSGIRSFVKLMRGEAAIARQKPAGQTHIVVLGIERSVSRTVSPTRAEQRRARQHAVEVAMAWAQLRRERPHLPEAPPTPRARDAHNMPDFSNVPLHATGLAASSGGSARRSRAAVPAPAVETVVTTRTILAEVGARGQGELTEEESSPSPKRMHLSVDLGSDWRRRHPTRRLQRRQPLCGVHEEAAVAERDVVLDCRRPTGCRLAFSPRH